MGAERLTDSSHTRMRRGDLARVDISERAPLLRTIAEAHQLTGWMLFDRGSVGWPPVVRRRPTPETTAGHWIWSLLSADPCRIHEHVERRSGPRRRRAYGSSWARRSGNRRLTGFVATDGSASTRQLGEAEDSLLRPTWYNGAVSKRRSSAETTFTELGFPLSVPCERSSNSSR